MFALTLYQTTNSLTFQDEGIRRWHIKYGSILENNFPGLVQI